MTRPTQAAIATAMEMQAPPPAAPMVAAATLTPMEMIDRALSSGAGVDVLERLMGLQERWEASQGRRAYNEAIAAARASLPVVLKTRTAIRGERGGSYQYEDMAAIAAVVDPVLAAEGLSYRFRTETREGRIFVTCIISHRGGYSEETTLDAPRDDSGGKNAVQGIGSTVTYLQRYTLKAALGIAASKDTDAVKKDDKPADSLTAEDYQKLRAKIDAQGDEAEKVEEYLLRKFCAETLRDITKQQCADAIAMLVKREQAKGGSNARA